MKSVLAAICLFLSILLLSFFSVFAFHAHTPVQDDVKHYLETGKGELPFSDNANDHMRDVYTLLSWARIIGAILIIITLFLLSHSTAVGLRSTGLVLLGIVLVCASIPFRQFEILFHNIFFPQGNWMFSYHSLLIQTYPPQYFVVQASILAGIIAVCAIVCILISRTLPASAPRQEVWDQ